MPLNLQLVIKKILHGESIFLGMYLAIKFSVFMKLCSKKILESYINHLEQIKIPFKLTDYNIKISIKFYQAYKVR